MPIGVVLPLVDPSELEITIDVNVPSDFLSTDKFDSALSSSMKKMAAEARDFWVSEAGRRLKSSREQYQQAIRVDTVGNEDFSLVLDGGFIQFAVETGAPAYNMNIQNGKIVPLNVNRDIRFVDPKVFRTSVGKPWKHPGFAAKNITTDVMNHIQHKIIPKYIQKIVAEL